MPYIIKIKVLLHMTLKKKHKLLGFRIRAAEHCNLNCKACDNFAPLAEPEFVDLKQLQNDLARLGELFEHKCDYIELTGGEPLLNPNLIEIIKLARDAFPYCNIRVFSNGILLAQQNDEFWKACRDYNVHIIVSAYPININIDAIKAKTASYGINFQWAWGEKEGERSDSFEIRPVNLKGNSNIKMNFASCFRANNCVYLHDGRLYTCSFVVNVRHFNKYFKQNIPVTEADSINIYDDITGDEILSRLAEPIPICRYCDLHARRIKWSVSKRELSEWI